jgi:hypothetical protein
VRLNTGAKIIQRSFRGKFGAQILDSFKAHLSNDKFCSFEKEFNKNRKVLQIEEDVAPFTEDKQHSWTLDGLPDIEDVAITAAGGRTPGNDIITPSQCTVHQFDGYNRRTDG